MFSGVSNRSHGEEALKSTLEERRANSKIAFILAFAATKGRGQKTPSLPFRVPYSGHFETISGPLKPTHGLSGPPACGLGGVGVIACPSRPAGCCCDIAHLRDRRLALVTGLLLALSGARTASAQFEVRGDFSALGAPFAISVGDFNHDGTPDLAIAAGGDYKDDVAVLLGHGDGTFGPPALYLAGVGGNSIAAADLDNDGNLDLVVASQSGYIAILMGKGDGTFQPATETPPVAPFETYVAVGDFNRDGIPDLVALAPGGAGEISVLMGNGDGTFQSAVTTQPQFAVQAIGLGDFNRDGDLDLVAAGQFGVGSELNILLGNGDGTFRQGASYTGDNSPESIAVADFNGDHKLDFAVANLDGVGIGVWLGNGDGTFEQGVNYATQSPISVTAGGFA